MNPAERYMALKAVKHGLDAAIAKTFAEIEQVRTMTGAKSFTTNYGALTMTVRQPSIALDETALLAWAKEHAAHEVVVTETVRLTLRKTLEARFTIVDGEVVDSETGEIVPWARIKPGSEHLTASLSPEAKEQAAAAVLDRLDAVAGLLEVEH